MSEPRAVPLSKTEWADDVPGIRDQAITVENARWAVVEYAEGAWREEWCTEGHRGFVIEGEIEYEFDDGNEPIRVGRGEAFLLPAGSVHRGHNRADGPTTMFLIDDPVAPETA